MAAASGFRRPALLRSILILLLAATGAGSKARAADYYVRIDGSDACDGLADEPDGAGSCAFRTIAMCNTTAGCGDVCRISPGDFYEAGFEIADVCEAGNEKRFVGTGVGATNWFMDMVDIDDDTCTKDVDGDGIYDLTLSWRCDRPAELTVTDQLGISVIQRYTAAVYGQDTSDASIVWEMNGPAPLTWNIRSSDNVEQNEGHVYADATALFIRPWNDRQTGMSPDRTDFSAARECPDGSAQVVSGSHVMITDMTMISGCNVALALGTADATASSITLLRLDIYGGGLSFAQNSENAFVRRVSVKNKYRRFVHDAAGVQGVDTIWGDPGALVEVRGTGHVFEEGWAGYGRNGWSVMDAATDITIRRWKTTGCYNHVAIITGGSDNILIQDSEFFNANDFQISCARNVSVENCTIFSQMLVEDAICPGYAVNVDVHNSWVCTWAYLDTTWESGGHELDFNLYPTDHTQCHGTAADPFTIQTRTFATLADLQGWDGDIDGDSNPDCGDCTWDGNSAAEDISTTFLELPPAHDDTSSRDLDLSPSSMGVDRGDPAFGSGVDVECALRVGNPDTGAYEAQSEPYDGGPPTDGGTTGDGGDTVDASGTGNGGGGKKGCGCRAAAAQSADGLLVLLALLLTLAQAVGRTRRR